MGTVVVVLGSANKYLFGRTIHPLLNKQIFICRTQNNNNSTHNNNDTTPNNTNGTPNNDRTPNNNGKNPTTTIHINIHNRWMDNSCFAHYQCDSNTNFQTQKSKNSFKSLWRDEVILPDIKGSSSQWRD
jgi:hypothetical protein